MPEDLGKGMVRCREGPNCALGCFFQGAPGSSQMPMEAARVSVKSALTIRSTGFRAPCPGLPVSGRR